MALLTKVTIGCGPAVYNADSSTVAGSDKGELETVKNNFLVKKLGLADGPALMDAIHAVIETYGKSERQKHRAVIYYRAPRFLPVFSAGAWCDRFEVCSGLLTGGLVGGFVSVMRSLGCETARIAA